MFLEGWVLVLFLQIFTLWNRVSSTVFLQPQNLHLTSAVLLSLVDRFFWVSP